MRRPRVASLIVLGLFGGGCAEKEAADPGELVREEMAARAGAPSRSVRCAADPEGGLHVQAPGGSRIVTGNEPVAFAEISLVDEPPRPVRRSKSLGFIGDGKLTETPSRGGPWNVPDALLPAHRHHEPHYGTGYRRGHAPGWSARFGPPRR